MQLRTSSGLRYFSSSSATRTGMALRNTSCLSAIRLSMSFTSRRSLGCCRRNQVAARQAPELVSGWLSEYYENPDEYGFQVLLRFERDTNVDDVSQYIESSCDETLS